MEQQNFVNRLAEFEASVEQARLEREQQQAERAAFVQKASAMRQAMAAGIVAPMVGNPLAKLNDAYLDSQANAIEAQRQRRVSAAEQTASDPERFLPGPLPPTSPLHKAIKQAAINKDWEQS